MTDRARTFDAEMDGQEVVTHARAWIGTPYVHQASCRGAGTDCLGLLRGLWRELLGAEPERVPPYTANWSEPQRVEELLMAASRHLVLVPGKAARAGDVVILRMFDHAIAKHLGILADRTPGCETIIHAYSGHGVVESPLTPDWARRIAGVFRFPRRRP